MVRISGAKQCFDSKAESIVSGIRGGYSAFFHCAACGLLAKKPLRHYQYQYVKGNRFCSRKCYADQRLKKRVRLTCRTCSVTFLRKRSEVADSKYCSRPCFYKSQLKDLVSEWKRDRGRFSRIVRGAILIRDKFQCQRCGSKSVRLEVHHIKSFRHFKALRLVKENCITLCPSCHREVDTWRRRFPANSANSNATHLTL